MRRWTRFAQADRAAQTGCALDVRVGAAGACLAHRDPRTECRVAAAGRDQYIAAWAYNCSRRARGHGPSCADAILACGGPLFARAGRAVARCRALPVQLPVLTRGRGGGQAGQPACRGFHPCTQGPARIGSARPRQTGALEHGGSGAGGRRPPARHRFSTALTSAGAECSPHGPEPPPSAHCRRGRHCCARRAAVRLRPRRRAFRRCIRARPTTRATPCSAPSTRRHGPAFR